MFIDNIETYWAMASHIIAILGYMMEGWIFYQFVKPFMKGKACIVGISYSITMLVFYAMPQEITYPNLQGALMACIIMCFLEKRNHKQKVFLVTCMYLFRWVVYGVTLVLRDFMFALFINTPHMFAKPVQQWITYIMVELTYYSIALTVMCLVIKLIHKIYVNKKEDISGKELVLLFATLMTVMTGYFTFNFLSNVYIEDMESYIWVVHPEYTVLRVIYQIISFAVILIAITVYQKLKEKQQEEKENILLAGQIENTKQHIKEVEKLYEDIRALKHDMGNHICVLENLFCKLEKKINDTELLKNEDVELKKYLSQLKMTWNESVAEIKTGNPVTDVILIQKQKEAEEKGIAFECQFGYPVDSNINAFDISVILNNSIENAFAGTRGCEQPYISILSYRQKNAYMLEIKNSICKRVEVDKETGLPETTKEDKVSHGYGLSNIRKVAQKYCGDIDIRQDEKSFMLTVMLIVN